MKVIDLLNKIANKEIETNIDFFYKKEKYRHIDSLFGDYYVEEVLNDEVEIIEDKKIEKIDMFDNFTGYNWSNRELCEQLERNTIELNSKINEIIDKLNEVEK